MSDHLAQRLAVATTQPALDARGVPRSHLRRALASATQASVPSAAAAAQLAEVQDIVAGVLGVAVGPSMPLMQVCRPSSSPGSLAELYLRMWIFWEGVMPEGWLLPCACPLEPRIWMIVHQEHGSRTLCRLAWTLWGRLSCATPFPSALGLPCPPPLSSTTPQWKPLHMRWHPKTLAVRPEVVSHCPCRTKRMRGSLT